MAAPQNVFPVPATGPISNGYTPQEGQDLSQASKTATFADLIRALDFVTSLFQEKEVPCALMGGLALTFRGSKRNTYDLDITAACDMAGLRQVVNNNSRYVAHLVHHLGADFKERMKVPIGPPSGVMRVFVAVENDKWVQVDIMVSDPYYGAPKIEDFHNATETISIQTVLGLREYVLINLLTHFQAKLRAFRQRNASSDYQDLVFMCTTFFEQVAAFHDQLDYDHRAYFIQSFAKQNKGALNANRVKKIKKVLGVA